MKYQSLFCKKKYFKILFAENFPSLLSVNVKVQTLSLAKHTCQPKIITENITFALDIIICKDNQLNSDFILICTSHALKLFCKT